MTQSDFADKIRKLAKNVWFNEPMYKHTTFKIGGRADIFYEAENEEELIRVLSLCRENDLTVTVIGNGSNILVGDNGIRGIAVKTGGQFLKIEINGTSAFCGSAVLMSKFCSELARAGLSGLEFAAGIPGSVGGGVFMNAGAYGGSLSDRILSVRYIDDDLNLCERTVNELEFGYRHSYFSDRNCIICGCSFELEPAEYKDISAKMAEYNRMRTEKQPLELPSAGSVFKRPEGYFAGKLIQDAGLMGYKIGGAEVSKKHAGFIVNTGGATAADVMALISYIKKTVFDKYGVMLEEEIKLTGEM